jgi:hypothetical protein
MPVRWPFKWLRRRKFERRVLERPRLYAFETPNSTLFNIDPDGVAWAKFYNRDATYAWRIRPMTDEEMLKHVPIEGKAARGRPH